MRARSAASEAPMRRRIASASPAPSATELVIGPRGLVPSQPSATTSRVTPETDVATRIATPRRVTATPRAAAANR